MDPTYAHYYQGVQDVYYYNTQSPANIEGCRYTLGNLEFSDIFSEWESILAAILISAVLTLPAISVYFRTTAEKPMRSYFYSCLVKGIVSFLTSGLIVNDIARFLKLKAKQGCEYEAMTIPFLGAVLTEVVEIIFDFGRLVLCFQDPGKIDFYQNVRWNSRMLSSSTSTSPSRSGCSGCGTFIVMLRFAWFLPFYLLLSILWIVVFIGNILFGNSLDSSYFDSSSERTYILQGIAIFGSLSFSCTGAYYLFRMCSPYSSPNGEESGVGYFWSKFKLIAVDLPSVISTIFMRPSSLLIFWSAEFVNDIFPFVVSTFAEEGLGCLNPNHGGEDTGEPCSTKEASSRALNHSVRQQKGGTVKISRSLLPSSTREGEINSSPEDYYTVPSYRIDRTLPPILEEKITEADWQEFCNRTDEILEPSTLMRSRSSGLLFAILTILFGLILIVAAFSRENIIVVILVCITSMFLVVTSVVGTVLLGRISCSLMLIKSIFIFLALSASVMYWAVWSNWMPREYRHGHALFSLLLVPSCALASWACIKSCFRRKLYTERAMVEELEQLCKDDNRKRARRNTQLKFSLRTEDNRWKNIKIWCCRPGFSRGHSLQSVRGIDFVLQNCDHLDIEEGSLSNKEESEIDSIDSSEHENDGEASVPNNFVGTLDPDERQNTDTRISQNFEVLQGSPEFDHEVSTDEEIILNKQAIGDNSRTLLNDAKSGNVEQNRIETYDNQSAMIIRMASNKEQNTKNQKPNLEPVHVDLHHENPALMAASSSSKKIIGDESRTKSEIRRENKTDDTLPKEDEFKDMGKDAMTNADPASIVLGVDGEKSSKRIREHPTSQKKINLYSADDNISTASVREKQELHVQSDRRTIGYDELPSPMDCSDRVKLLDSETSDHVEHKKAPESNGRPTPTARSNENHSSSKNMTSREIWQNINRKKRK